nr:hypothetical protein [Tanacetum cinerariifolium]
MATSTYPIIILSDYDIEDAFASTKTPVYISVSPDYFPSLLGNSFSNPSEGLYKYLLALLAISPFHDDPYMKVMQAYNATSNETLILPQAPIAPPTILPSSPIAGLQREQMRHNDEIVLARVKISTVEMINEDIQVRHRSDMKGLLDKIHELKNHKGGPPGY